MAKLEWDKVGEHFYETGVDHAVLYLRDTAGKYTKGYAWERCDFDLRISVGCRSKRAVCR